jgi:hypothetical protein
MGTEPPLPMVTFALAEPEWLAFEKEDAPNPVRARKRTKPRIRVVSIVILLEITLEIFLWTSPVISR